MTTHRDADFDAFCVAAYPRLVGALSHVCGEPAVAEELAQEALVRAHQRWIDVAAMASPIGWTVHVGANLARSHLRRRRLERRVQGQHGPGGDGHHHDPDGADTVATRRAVASLPAAQREAVVLRHVVGLSAEEIGATLGVPAATIRKRTERGLATLRTQLASDDAEEIAR